MTDFKILVNSLLWKNVSAGVFCVAVIVVAIVLFSVVKTISLLRKRG